MHESFSGLQVEAAKIMIATGKSRSYPARPSNRDRKITSGSLTYPCNERNVILHEFIHFEGMYLEFQYAMTARK